MIKVFCSMNKQRDEIEIEVDGEDGNKYYAL
jgi:hypothetical protein